MLKKSHKIISSIAFIIIEVVLWCLILTIDGNANKYLSFSSVLLAFLFSLPFIGLKKHGYLTQIALLFTVTADVFLVLLDVQNKSVAMTSFSVVQIAYFIRICLETKNKKVNLINLIVRVVLSVAIEIITLLVLKENVDYVSLISMFYYVNLILNVVFAFVIIKKVPLLAIGLLCFLLCDTFVGLSMAIGTYISISANTWIYNVVFAPFNFIWFFYVPSQALLALSCVWKKKVLT